MEKEIVKNFSDWNSLNQSIISSVQDCSQKILIQCGHFSVLFDKEGNLVPAILEEITDNNLKDLVQTSNYMGDFPMTTFENGVYLASILKKQVKNIKFAFIVNDWQWVNKGIYSTQINRKDFFKSQIIPISYQNIFTASSFDNSDIIKANHFGENGIYFSEHKLRKQGNKRVTDCSPKSCVVEYLPFLHQVMSEYDTLISFIPNSCKIPVLYSTVKYIQEQNKKLDFFHVFYEPSKEISLSHLNKDIINEDVVKTINGKFGIMELMSQ